MTENPVDIHGSQRTGPALILCEHASAHIPARYKGLGLQPQDRKSHAAWDPGALAVARYLSDALASPLIASTVSRLVYDCNRPPEVPSATPVKSELVEIPGNQDLSDADRQERVDTVYTPFCTAVSAQIAAHEPTALITMHSFTPIYYGKPRACEIGLLHDEDTRMADAMLNAAHLTPHRLVERNVPYGPEDGVTHSLKLHGLANGLPNVMVEIRNDLIASPDQQQAMAEDMLTLIRPALAGLKAQGS